MSLKQIEARAYARDAARKLVQAQKLIQQTYESDFGLIGLDEIGKSAKKAARQEKRATKKQARQERRETKRGGGAPPQSGSGGGGGDTENVESDTPGSSPAPESAKAQLKQAANVIVRGANAVEATKAIIAPKKDVALRTGAGVPIPSQAQRLIDEAAQSAERATSAADESQSFFQQNKLLIIGGAVVVAGAIAYFTLRKK